MVFNSNDTQIYSSRNRYLCWNCLLPSLNYSQVTVRTATKVFIVHTIRTDKN